MLNLAKKIGNIILVICLLFTVFTTNSVNAKQMKLSEDDELVVVHKEFEYELKNDSDTDFEFVAHDKIEDSYYSISISKKDDGSYEWKSQIELDGKILSEKKFKIKKLKKKIITKLLAEQIKNVLGDGLNEEKKNKLKETIDGTFEFENEKQGKIKENRNPEKTIHTNAVFLLPIAAGALSASTVAALETALYATVTAATAAIATVILEDRQNTSTKTNELSQSTVYPDHWSDFTGIPSSYTTTATKHMTQSAVEEISRRIKNDRNNDGDLEIFTTTTPTRSGASVLLVYNITSDLNATVNRHLGNWVNLSQVADPNIRNEYLNLKGYSVFLIYNYDSNKLFHVHFVPTADRQTELSYQRKRGAFDLRIYSYIAYSPSVNEFLQRTDTDMLAWEQRYNRSLLDRNLNRDSRGYKSVVPYK